MTLGDNRRVDLSQCLIVMTSNLGASEMNDMISGGLGFSTSKAGEDNRLDEKVGRAAVEAARPALVVVARSAAGKQRAVDLKRFEELRHENTKDGKTRN